MTLVIRFFLAFMLLLFVCTGNASTSYTLEKDAGKSIDYQEIFDESICGDQIRFKAQQEILKKHRLTNKTQPDNRYAWLSSPYHCALVSIKNQDFYIYDLDDKNTPIYVFILLNKVSKEYLLATVDRDYSQDISEGKVSYMGPLANDKLAVQVLGSYISDQNYGGVR